MVTRWAAAAWIDNKGAKDVGTTQAWLLWLLGGPASIARVPGEAPRAPVRLAMVSYGKASMATIGAKGGPFPSIGTTGRLDSSSVVT